MKTQTSNAIAYCFDLLGFVFQNPEAGKKIKAIYVFGSAVRGELHTKSDIDLFIECAAQDEIRAEQLANSGIVKFTVSKDYHKWKLLHFTYPFSIQVGKISEWDLKLSIASEGILLYSTGNIISDGTRSVLFTITYPAHKKGYIKVRRLLFGRDEEFYQGTGIVSSMRGKKISSTVFIIPKEEQTRMIDILAKAKVEFSMNEIGRAHV